jgi:MFS family permease
MDLSQAAMFAGGLVLMAGIGMTLGGALVDRLSTRYARNRLLVPMCYALGSSFLLLAALLLADGQLQLLLIGLGLLIGAGFAGPSGAVVSSVTNASLRASVLATLTLGNNILGLAPGPFITGLLADSFNLHLAMTLVPLIGLGAAAAYFAASRHYLQDLQLQQNSRPAH